MPFICRIYSDDEIEVTRIFSNQIKPTSPAEIVVSNEKELIDLLVGSGITKEEAMNNISPILNNKQIYTKF